MRISYGVMSNFDEETNEFDYIACVAVASSEELPQGMVSFKVPDQTYAVFKCSLPMLRDAFQYAHRWFADSDHERSTGSEFELYGSEFHVDQTMYLYVPIRSD